MRSGMEILMLMGVAACLREALFMGILKRSIEIV